MQRGSLPKQNAREQFNLKEIHQIFSKQSKKKTCLDLILLSAYAGIDIKLGDGI